MGSGAHILISDMKSSWFVCLLASQPLSCWCWSCYILFVMRFSLIVPYSGFTAEIPWNLGNSVLCISPSLLSLISFWLCGSFAIRINFRCGHRESKYFVPQSKAEHGKANWNALTAQRKMKPRMQLHNHPQWIMYSTSEHRNTHIHATHCTLYVCVRVNWIWLHFASGWNRGVHWIYMKYRSDLLLNSNKLSVAVFQPPVLWMHIYSMQMKQEKWSDNGWKEPNDMARSRWHFRLSICHSLRLHPFSECVNACTDYMYSTGLA